jgi:hypothetical protein
MKNRRIIKRIMLLIIVLVTMFTIYVLFIGTGSKTIVVKEIKTVVYYGKPKMILETTDNEKFIIANSYSFVDYEAGKTYKVKTSMGSPYKSIIDGEEIIK